MASVMARGSTWPVLLVLCVAFFSLFGFSPLASGKRVHSFIDTKESPAIHSEGHQDPLLQYGNGEDWKFLTRFCFLSQKGRFDFTFKYPKSYGIQQLLLYYDAPGQWESVYRSSKNCSARRSILSKANNQIIDLTNKRTDSRDAGCSVYTQDGEEYYNCTDEVTFRAMRERWWYIVLARCEPSVSGKFGLKLEYQMHMMNGPDDDYLHHELSADEFYILPVDIAFLVVFTILLVLSIVCAVKLSYRQMFHTTYKMYMTALCLWIFGLFLQCIAWGKYGETGWEEGSTEVTGRLFLAASTTVFLLMLLLMAKGYTITRGRLTKMSSIRLTIFFCLYIIINITLFIWEGAFFDEGYVLYFYESPPGYGLVAMRIVGWVWFLYAFAFTMKHHPDKAKFYVPFFIFYSAWFWAGPIVIVVAITAIAKWSREKTVNGVEQFVALCGYLFFLVLTRPSAANSNFPFHLRVSQVRFLDDDEDQGPTEAYGVSEESQRYLDSIFTVQGPSGMGTTSRPSGHSHSRPHASYPKAANGHLNGGSDGYNGAGNGYSSYLESTFTTQPGNHIPPWTTGVPSRNNGYQLPPSYDHSNHPPTYDNDPQQSHPTQGPRLPSLQVGGHHFPPLYDEVPRLPPLRDEGSQLPPLQDEDQQLDGHQAGVQPLQNGNRRMQQLPPINNGRLPPIWKQPSAPSEND